jgi:hypothetical protein
VSNETPESSGTIYSKITAYQVMHFTALELYSTLLLRATMWMASVLPMGIPQDTTSGPLLQERMNNDNHMLVPALMVLQLHPLWEMIIFVRLETEVMNGL